MAYRHDTETHSPVSDVARPISIRRLREGFSALTRRMATGVSGVCALFARVRPNGPSVQCADPEDAYLQACLAATPFCYVSPALYGLGRDADRRCEAGPATEPGDDA